MTTERAPTPAFVFFFLNVCVGWPVGVVGGALSNALVSSGYTVGQTAAIVAAVSVPFALQFIWGPIVDSSATRRVWFLIGASMMGLGLAALLAAPWAVGNARWLAMFASVAGLGAALSAAATKGLMAYHAPLHRVASVSGWYIAGGGLSHSLAGAGTLWLLTHAGSRPLVAMISAGAVAIAAAPIAFLRREQPARIGEFPDKLATALAETWSLIRTRRGLLVAVLCVIPFGSGGATGLFGAVAREWSVGPDLLALLGALGMVGGVLAPLFAGWLGVRFGPRTTYVALGWALIAAAVMLAVLPRHRAEFAALDLLYRGLARAATAALLGIVMTTVGKGAASTKASALWGLGNLTAVYPDLIEGAVHDRSGVTAMLLTDAGLALAGYIALLAITRILGMRLADAPNGVSPEPS